MKKFSGKKILKLQNNLIKFGKTITCAESCTGGRVASAITSISGSSHIFNGSIVSYSNNIKHLELKVKKSTLKKYGAVSKKVVKEMLDGVLSKFNADFAIAVSGVAGPNGGTNNKPVGMVIIGVGTIKLKKIKIYNFKGNREIIQKKARNRSLKEISKFILKTLDK